MGKARIEASKMADDEQAERGKGLMELFAEADGALFEVHRAMEKQLEGSDFWREVYGMRVRLGGALREHAKYRLAAQARAVQGEGG